MGARKNNSGCQPIDCVPNSWQHERIRRGIQREKTMLTNRPKPCHLNPLDFIYQKFVEGGSRSTWYEEFGSPQRPPGR